MLVHCLDASESWWWWWGTLKGNRFLGLASVGLRSIMFKSSRGALKAGPGLIYNYGSWEGTNKNTWEKKQILGLTHRAKFQNASVRNLLFATLLFLIYSSRCMGWWWWWWGVVRIPRQPEAWSWIINSILITYYSILKESLCPFLDINTLHTPTHTSLHND